MLGVVTGKPLAIGGSLGRIEATARGSAYCIREALRKRQRARAGKRVAIQGFGNVGSNLALILAADGATIVGLSDSRGGISNADGIDVDAAIAHKREHGTLAGFPGAEEITNEELLMLDCDVLAPCALEQVITAENADKVKAPIVVRGRQRPGDAGSRPDPRGPRRPRPPRTCSPTRAASSSPTSSGCRASRSTSGRKPRSTRS